MSKLKTIKLLGLLSFIWDDLLLFLDNFYKGKPVIDGIILLSANTNIKKNLISTIQNINTDNIAVKFLIYGDGINKLSCKHLDLISNNIYVYLRDSHLCSKKYQTVSSLLDRVNIPINEKILFNSSPHFTFFGDNRKVTEFDINNMISNLPYKATAIYYGNIFHQGLNSLDDELILNHFIRNPGNNNIVDYITSITYNPDDSIFAAKDMADVKIYKSDISQLQNFSDMGILDWQKSEVTRFKQFLASTRVLEQDVFLRNFIENNLPDDEHIENWLMKNTDFKRFKELYFLVNASKNNTVNMELLLDSGVDIDCSTNNNSTALHIAAHLNNISLGVFLLSHGADYNAAMHNGITPIMLAARKNYIEFVDILIKIGADINIPDRAGNTALMLAASKNAANAIDLLLFHDAKINIQNNIGDTAIIVAANMGYDNIIIKLYNHGANLEISNTENFDPLKIALQQNFYSTAMLLIGYEVKTNKEHIKIALENYHFEIANLLIQYHYTYPLQKPQHQDLIINFVLQNYHSSDEAKIIIDEYVEEYSFYKNEITLIQKCLSELDPNMSYILNYFC